MDVMSNGLRILAQVAGGVINVIAAVLDMINPMISAAVGGINTLIRAYNSIPFLPNVSQISAPSITVPKVDVSNIAGSTPSITTSSIPDMNGGGSTSGGSGVSSAAAGAAQFFNPSANYVPSFGKSSSMALMEAGQLQRDTSIVINVNAPSVIDEEGFSRAVSSAMNNGYYRGTGGASQFVGIK